MKFMFQCAVHYKTYNKVNEYDKTIKKVFYLFSLSGKIKNIYFNLLRNCLSCSGCPLSDRKLKRTSINIIIINIIQLTRVSPSPNNKIGHSVPP